MDEGNQNGFDSYEWDREEGDYFENSPAKRGNPKSGANTTKNIKANT